MSTPSLASLAASVNAPPTDQNLLQPSTFQVSFMRLPYVQFFVQDVNIPGLSTSPPIQATPFVNVPIAANKLTYEYFVMTFIIDEGLWSWQSVQNWLYGIAFPESFAQFRSLTMQQRIQIKNQKPQYSDGILTVFTNKNNPILKVQFTDLFPVSLSGIQFSTKQDASTILTATATFGFAHYDIIRSV
jgi:hypothetical protein